MTFDELRATRPDLGFAVYAYTPGEPVTFEILAGGDTFTFVAPTLDAAIAAAFPPEETADDVFD